MAAAAAAAADADAAADACAPSAKRPRLSQRQADERSTSVPLPLPPLPPPPPLLKDVVDIHSPPESPMSMHEEMDETKHRHRSQDSDDAAPQPHASLPDTSISQGPSSVFGEMGARHAHCHGKLALVLDLDPGGMVDVAGEEEVAPDLRRRLESAVAAESSSLPDSRRDLFHLPRLRLDSSTCSGGGGLWIKIRPGARELMERAGERYELWASTMGSRAYADAIIDLIDPGNRAFGSRVIAMGGSGASGGAGVLTSRLMGALEARASAALVLQQAPVAAAAQLISMPSTQEPAVETAAVAAPGSLMCFLSPRNLVPLEPYRYFGTVGPLGLRPSGVTAPTGPALLLLSR
jgi:hypothetical protein